MAHRAAGFGVVFLGLSGAGCGEVTSSPSSTPPPVEAMTGSAYAGGTRLRAVLAEASDGTASFFHWWDSELGVTCQFEPVEERGASFRCRPTSGPVIYGGIDEAFGDAECTEPLVSEATLPAGGPRVVRRLSTRCYAASEYFGLGARFTGAVVYRKTDGGCLPGDQAANESPPLFTVEALPPSAFVAAHDASVPAAPGVAVGQIVAEDGSRAPDGLHDVTGFRCWPRRTVEGTRCLPDQFGWGDRGGVYSDADCRVPAAVSESGCGDARGYLPYVFSEAPGIGGDVATVRVGGARLPDVFHQVGAGECAAGVGETVAFAIGEPVELGGFRPASLSQETRPSGLVQTVAAVDGVAIARFADLSASALGGYACELAATPDGAVHCVPWIGYTEEQYADAACTDPIWQSDFDIRSVASGTLEVAAGTTDPVTLPAIERVLVGGTPYDGPVYTRRGAECTRVMGVPNTRQPYQRFSGEARLSELPTLSIVVR